MTRTMIAAAAALIFAAAVAAQDDAAAPATEPPATDAPATEAAAEAPAADVPLPPELDPQPVPAAERQAVLDEIDAYLAELDVLTGSFFQIEPTGVVSQGEFWIDRPGLMRFEYADPHPFTLVSDGANYTVWDRELNDVNTEVPLRETPLNMFLRRDVALSRDADVVDLTQTPGELALTLKDRDERVEGTLTLVFAAPALELRRFSTTDGAGAETEVLLTDTVRGGDVDPGLFVIREQQRRRDR